MLRCCEAAILNVGLTVRGQQYIDDAMRQRNETAKQIDGLRSSDAPRASLSDWHSLAIDSLSALPRPVQSFAAHSTRLGQPPVGRPSAVGCDCGVDALLPGARLAVVFAAFKRAPAVTQCQWSETQRARRSLPACLPAIPFPRGSGRVRRGKARRGEDR